MLSARSAQSQWDFSPPYLRTRVRGLFSGSCEGLHVYFGACFEAPASAVQVFVCRVFVSSSLFFSAAPLSAFRITKQLGLWQSSC